MTLLLAAEASNVLVLGLLARTVFIFPTRSINGILVFVFLAEVLAVLAAGSFLGGLATAPPHLPAIF